MEWIVGPGSNEVDIGYVPLMRIFSFPSFPWKSDIQSSSFDINKDTFDPSTIVWNQELSIREVTREIEKTFYPFKQVIHRT